MQNIRNQRDLALLPEPRLIWGLSARMRLWMTVILVALILFTGGITVGGTLVAGFPFFPYALAGVLPVVPLAAGLVFMHRSNWRSFIQLVATPDGLHIVVSSRRIVFVAWTDVVAIELAPRKFVSSGPLQLTLRLDRDDWSQFRSFFGATGRLLGNGPARRYIFHQQRYVELPKTLVSDLEAFRDENWKG